MKIREYRTEDYSQVLALWKTGGLIIGRSDTQEALEMQRERDADLFLVAEENGRITGVVLGRWGGRRGWINRLAVSMAHRHKLIGSLLIAEVEKRLKVKGCEKINLLIDPDNSGVQVFYKQSGYSRDDLIFMEKWLV